MQGYRRTRDTFTNCIISALSYELNDEMDYENETTLCINLNIVTNEDPYFNPNTLASDC